VRAITYDGPARGGGSQAQMFTCGDGYTYVVKFIGNPHGTRILATEQVVGDLGFYIGAPVPPVAHVEVSQTLIDQNKISINGVAAIAGVHHGSQWQTDCGDRLWIDNANEPDNPSRFASLCVLYTWVGAADHQLIYRNSAPRVVFSVDHGHFFPGSTTWNATTLQQAPAAVIDTQFAGLGLDNALYAPFVDRLAAINPQRIAQSVARVHATWTVSDNDLIALAAFLSDRAAQTATLFA
jgi:hypothetical protein